MRRAKHTATAGQPKDKLLTKITLFFFARTRTTALIWLVIAAFGIASYTTLLRREGFPSINIPVAIVNGTYFVNDPARVDREIAKPISELAAKEEGVSTVQTSSSGNFFSVSLQYKEGTDAKEASKKLEERVAALNLPKDANISYSVPYFGATGGDLDKIDIAISFFKSDNDANTQEVADKAAAAARWLEGQNLSLVEKVTVKQPFSEAVNPATGKVATVQRSFDRFGERKDSQNSFYDSVLIAVAAKDNTDVIKLDDQIHAALSRLAQQPEFAGYHAEISASFAPSIKENISELQRVLLEGLLAVLVIGSIVIAVRASLITVVSMITVLVSAIGLLYLLGYTLNVITLFSLILGLSLIVDDTIIMVEAIDAARRKQKTPKAVVEVATRKVSRAMVAATLTACLSFAPLAFVSGVLGSFIRAIPVTIISSLLISLFVALIFIPLFARYLLLGKKQMGDNGVKEIAAGFESRIAHAIARPMLWARHSRKRLVSVGIVALVIGFGFIGAGGFIAQKVTFNIFPPTKDTNGLIITYAYPPGQTFADAQAIADRADKLVARELGDNFEQASYYATGDERSATMQITIKPYTKREVTSPELVKQVQAAFDKEFAGVQVSVGQMDVGPPAGAFTVQLASENRQAAFAAANDIAAYLRDVKLTRPSGTEARIKNVAVSSPSQYTRSKGKLNVQVNAVFVDSDTTTLVTLAQDALKKEFTGDKLASYGLAKDAMQFDIGQESENQDSFKTLALAFPAVLLAIYLLLALQFRSLLQPLLIFMAIPFSIFGVMLGLYLSDNPISFFSMLGFFALIGLSIKNTILLTDFANQARKQGMGAVDAAVAALGERFRPLVATSLTAVVSLIPLAIISPFWQGLAVVLIFGLLSSTLLVITVFPYYYLGAEYLRLRFSRRAGLGLFALAIASLVLSVKFKVPAYLVLVLPLVVKAVRQRRSSRA